MFLATQLASCSVALLYLQSVPLPISKNQFRRLGDRLRNSVVLGEDDAQLLEQVRQAYKEALEEVASRLSTSCIQDIGQRVKTTHTLVDKLRRERGIAIDKFATLAERA